MIDVSRIERRTDLMRSGYLEAMGGELNSIVEFRDCPLVKIMELADLEEFTD